MWSHDENLIIDNAITDMNRRLNNWLTEFSHCDRGILSGLFKTYCMDMKRWDIILWFHGI